MYQISNNMQKLILTGLLLLISNFSFSQEIDNRISDVDSTYLIYQEQLRDLYISRGMGSVKNEIDSIMSLYKTNQINSNENFAKILATLFPKDQGICVLTYFFYQNNLKIILFEPGAIIQVKNLPITKEELISLNNNVIGSLNVFDQTAKRAPRLRGSIIESEDSEVSFEEAVKLATETLLPDSFTEKYKHLIIIPAFNIGVFPFHLLKPYKDGNYLIEKCSFTIAPSLLDVIALRTRVIKKASGGSISTDQINQMLSNAIPYKNRRTVKATFEFKNPLLVCNPKYPKNTKYIFPDLPGAKQEIDSAISYSKDYTLLTGKYAVKDSVISLMNNRDIVYFATHGIADQEYPMEKSFLVLSNPQPFLTAKDLMDLRLDKSFHFPEMVILSACQTGLGRYLEAGVAGLARPFLIGGSNHVVMSLWSVDDKATAYLMSRFIHHLKTPMLHAPSEQLRMAILDTMKRYPNPAHWSSFSIFGIDY
jgi:CHAT domain-containing protein